MIKYCRNFSKAKLIENPKAIQDTTNQAYDSLKKILPETPQKIDTETVEILPFNLPITKRSQTGIIVKALRLIYKFNTLPDSYFTKLPKLPEYPDQIIEDKLKKINSSSSQSQITIEPENILPKN